MSAFELRLGDCLAVLAELPDANIDACVSDPPYELGFMGKKWDASGIAYSVELWREVLRVLKPGGHLLAFGGTRTYHRMTVAIEDAGFEIRDSLLWLYGTGFPKSLNIGDGRGTALKPAHEPIVMARKPLAGTVAANVLAHGTGAINIDACRIEGGARKLIDATANVITGDGRFGTMGGSKAAGETTLGRWPANVILDEEAAAMLDEQSGVTKSTGGGGRHEAGEDTRHGIYGKFGARDLPPNVGRGDTGGASRFFYVAKASRAERDRGCEHLPARSAGEATDREDGSDGLNSPRAGAGRTGGAKNHHPTVKPVTLMRYLVRMVTPPSGVVLDPFMGSGTTGVACMAEWLRFIGIEQSAEYIAIAEARINHAVAQRGLFTENT